MPNLVGELATNFDPPEGDADDINPVTGIGKRIGDIIMDVDRMYRQVCKRFS